jgi:hypothetical protein
MKSGPGESVERERRLRRRRRRKQHPNIKAATARTERGTPTPIAIFVRRDMPGSPNVAAGASGTVVDLLGFAVEAVPVLAVIVTIDVMNLVVGD